MDDEVWYWVVRGVGLVVCFGPALFCAVVLTWRYIRKRRKRRPIYYDD
jgi:hypothetical protein